MNSNYGTITGFKITFLSKIIDVKNGDTTLMHLVARMILTQEPDLVNFVDDMKPLFELKKISTNSIQEDFNELKMSHSVVASEAQEAKKYHENPDYHRKDALYAKAVEQFSADIAPKIELAEKQCGDVFQQVDGVFSFFGEPKGSKLTIEELMGHLKKFVTNFERTLLLVQTMARKEEKKAAQAPATPVKTKTTPVSEKEETPKQDLDTIEKSRHLDNLLENLKSKPALESFELLQRPKHREAFGSEKRRFPRARNLTPKLLPTPVKQKANNSFADETWKLLDSIDIGGLDLNFD